MSIYASIDSHRSMIFDETRNRAFERALKEVVNPGCTVLDLGAGLGIHGLMAAKLGAKRVYLVDSSPVVLQAIEIAKKNGIEDKVEVIRGRIEEVELPETVDVIVSVFTGNFLLGEDLLPSLFEARDRYLAAGGVLIPDRGRMMAALVQAKAFYENRVARWSKPSLNLSFSALRKFAANEVYHASATAMDARLLSSAMELLELDFSSSAHAACRNSVSLRATDSGVCHGVLGWFDMRLGKDWVSTGPKAEPMHWPQTFLPLDPPLELSQSEEIQFELDRPEYGEWSWAVTARGKRQHHSTFMSRPIDLGYLKKQSFDFAPGLGEKGELALFVLKRLSEGCTVAEIVSGAKERFPILVQRDRRWEQRIRDLVGQWGRDGA